MTKAKTVGQRRRRTTAPPQPTEQPQAAPIMAPTPEAMQHGSYTRADTTRAAFVNDASTYLGKLELRKAITPRQRKGGEAFADCYRLAWSISGKDSCVLRVGGVVHETSSQAERVIARKAKLDKVRDRLRGRGYMLLLNVSVFDSVRMGRDRGVNAMRYISLRAILDVCADVFDVPV